MKKQQEESYLEQLNKLQSRNCTNPLKKFCKDFLADYTRSDLQNFARACIQEDKIETFLQNPTLQIIPDELEAEELAKQFVAYFRLPKFPTLTNLLKLAKSMNIEQIEGLLLPKRIRGFHEEWEGTYSIKYKKDDWIGAIEHTILHEMREIMENIFEELLCPSYERLSGRALESEANLFAACVLMPRENFLSDVYELGFDVIGLQKKYRRAYSSILIRMMKVVSGRLPFIGVLYEKNGSETNGALLNVTYFVKTPNIKTNRKHGRLLWCYIPREGSNVVNSSIAYSVIKYGQSIYREKATGFDFFGYDDFSFIARPVYRKGHITKVAVIGVPYEHRTVLKVQLDKIDPLFLPECFQMI